MSMCHLNPELNPSLNPNSFQGISTDRCTRSMETVDFYPREFHEIPQQDNPAFDNHECMMIVKEHGGTKSCVLHIVPDPVEAVTKIALFWRHERAAEYAESFMPNRATTNKEEQRVIKKGKA